MLSLVLAALLGALSLFATAPATAQTTVWSGTLTVGTITDTLGCRNVVGSKALCRSESVLTENEFNYGGTRYSIRHLFLRRGDDLSINLSIVLELASNTDNANWPPVLASSAVLNVGSKPEPFNFADAIIDKHLALWSNTGLSWSDGDMVSLSIVVPTVSLSASPNPVTEGQPVTVTATLSEVLSEDVTIPLTVTAGTADSDDFGSLTSITINSGATTGTGTITTKLDADNDHETFTVTVELGTPPSPVIAGSPSSVQITINDYHGDNLKVTANPACGTDLSIVEPFPELSLDPSATVGYAAINAEGGELISLGNFHIQPPLYTSLTSVVQHYRRTYPSFAGFEFTHNSVTARCTWMFDSGTGGSSGEGGTSGGTNTDSGTTTGGSTGSGTPAGGPPAGGGGGGGGGGGLPPPSGSGDEPPPEDEEPSDPDQPDACGENDRENLERFYETTGGEQWDENENWNSDEAPQECFGVEMDEDGNVVSLRLSENNLSGNMPEELLLCLSELKELALWGNDLSGEVPEELVLAVERAVLRDIAEMLDLNPEWFENYGDPYNFEDWYGGVTTDEEGRVVELDLPGEVPGTLISQLRKLRVITTSSENGGCALSPKDDSSAFSLFLLALLVFAALGRRRAR